MASAPRRLSFRRFLTPPILAVVLAAPAAARAQGEPAKAGLLLAHRDGSCCEPAPSLGTAAHLVVTGALVRGEVTQVFLNPTGRTLEAVYVFPLLDGAAVYGFRMKVGERTIEGRVEPRDVARQTYEAATAEGRKASLLEQGSPDLFRLSVANLGPGEVVEVTLHYQHEVPYRDGRFSVRFPTVAPPRYGAMTDGVFPRSASGEPGGAGGPAGIAVGLRVDLAPGFPLARLESPTHELRVQELPAGGRVITLADELVPAHRDFVLEWSPAAVDRPLTSVAVEDEEGDRYVLALLVPPPMTRPGPTVPRDVVFVLDTSGSMEGESLRHARRAVRSAIARLEPTDRFNVIRFSSQAEALWETSRPAQAASVSEALQFVGGLQANGGTEMLPALELALPEGPAGDWRGVRQVVFLTDGQVNQVDGLLAALRRRIGDSRLFTVGIGPAPSSYVLRRMAEVGRGTATFIDDPARVAVDMKSLLRRLEGPVLTDVTLDWGVATAEAHPDPVPDLYAGQPLVVAARLSGSEGRLEVRGDTAFGPWSAEVPLSGPVGVTRAAGVARLWAQKEVEALEMSRLDGADPEEVRAAILRVALRHGLTSEATSLVAVDSRVTVPAALDARRRNVLVGSVGSAPAPAQASMLSHVITVSGSGAHLAEMIMVTSEAPIVDERRVSRGTTISQSELSDLPWPGSPWSLAVRTAGIVADRVDVAGAESLGQPGLLASAGEGAAAVRIDGLDVTALVPGGGLSLVDLAFAPLEAVELTLGGADVELETAGPTIDLVTARGSNRFRASGWAAWSDRELRSGRRAEAGGLDGLRALGLDIGGPIAVDRLWADVSGGGARLDTTAPFGGGGARSLDHAGGKLNAQPTSSASLAAFVRGSELVASGVGAGPTRTPEATLDETASGRAYRLEGTQVFSADLYATLAGGIVDRDDEAAPAAAGDPVLDGRGVLGGGDFLRSTEERVRSWDAEIHGYAGSGATNHEVVLGGRSRDERTELVRTASGRGLEVRAGELYGLPGTTEVLAAWRDGDVGARGRRLALWADDTITFRRLTLRAGLRWDRQELEALSGSVAGNAYDPLLGPASSGGFDLGTADTLSPRVGFTYVLDEGRAHLLRASFGRFPGRLDARIAGLVHPLRPAVTYSSFEDADGDLTIDDGELAGAGLITAVGVDPRSGEAAGEAAAGLEPEITDEVVLGYVWAMAPSTAVGVSAAWRHTDGVFEERYRVRDEASGEVFTATESDWVPAGTVSGSLPGGGTYEVPYFDLRPGLEWTGGTRLANGARARDSLTVAAEWTRRFAGSWMGRGQVAWSESRWRVPAAFGRFDDPTPEAGGGEESGQALVLGDLGSAPFAQARWSLFAGAGYRFDSGVEIAGSVTGREGFPVVYYRRVLREGAGPVDVAVTGEPDSRRTGGVVTLDARLAKELDLGSRSVELALEAFNLLDAGTVTVREGDLGSTRGGLANDLMAPRTLRLSVRLESW